MQAKMNNESSLNFSPNVIENDKGGLKNILENLWENSKDGD